MLQVPNNHAVIAFGTGAKRHILRPAFYHAFVNHIPIEPLSTLSENSARLLYAQHILWEKMFASALVARFFVVCWKRGEDPATYFVSSKELLPQKNDGDNNMLETVEVCLGNGIMASENEAFANTLFPPEAFDWKALHANWRIQSAHHDMIVPVCIRNSGKSVLWGLSAHDGNRKTEKVLLDTK